MGAYNALQQSDAHSYWEFNYTTNWIHPLYELPFTGGFPDRSPTEPADTFQDGEIGRAAVDRARATSRAQQPRAARARSTFGDNPDRPRDPDKFDAEDDAQREFRERFVPSGIAHEAFLNTFERLASFEPGEHDLTRRLLDGYKAAVALVDTNGDGIISAAEGDIDTREPATARQGDNTCLFLLPRELQPLRGDARDQRRPAGAALRAEHARLGAVGRRSSPASPVRRPPRGGTPTIAEPKAATSPGPRTTTSVSLDRRGAFATSRSAGRRFG